VWYEFKYINFYIFLDFVINKCIKISVCKEALEVLTLCLFLKPNYLSQLMEKKDWQTFFIDLILLANNRYCSNILF
jgi:hypothetical protein